LTVSRKWCAYGYDAQDNLARVTDLRSLATLYRYTGFDELEELESPDTGLTTHRYDPARNLAVRADARNPRGVYPYDALDRVEQIRYGVASGSDPSATEMSRGPASSPRANQSRMVLPGDSSRDAARSRRPVPAR